MIVASLGDDLEIKLFSLKTQKTKVGHGAVKQIEMVMRRKW